jgi:hypothetical protein
LFATQYDLLFRDAEIAEDASSVKAKRGLVFYVAKQNNKWLLDSGFPSLK